MPLQINNLAGRLIRMGPPEQHERCDRHIRPAVLETESEVQRWLFGHPEGGWLLTAEDARREAAGRFLFVLWLVRTGVVSDG